MLSIDAARTHMRRNRIDAWVLWDFRGSNHVFWHVLGERTHTTRRAVLFIFRDADPVLLTSAVDAVAFRHVAYRKVLYRGWQELHSQVRALLGSCRTLALEYSARGDLPTTGWVDAGTIELLRDWGYEIVSSADLFQVCALAWDDEALASHRRACPLVAGIKDAAFTRVSEAVAAGRGVTEWDIQSFIMAEFERLGLETENRPVVAVNGNSGDPHYEPTAEVHAPIRMGDWLLIDLWARFPGERHVFSDITWVAYVGPIVPQPMREVFEVVRDARDAAIGRLSQAWAAGEVLEGWQVDQVARDHIAAAGYAEQILHRTGHSMGPGDRVHALGVNIDNFETKDTRLILPRLGFSIEPGIYLPEFGVRLEVNVFMDPSAGPTVTTPLQNDIVLLAS
jgi:Xaa-Pro dipeptidase